MELPELVASLGFPFQTDTQTRIISRLAGVGRLTSRQERGRSMTGPSVVGCGFSPITLFGFHPAGYVGSISKVGVLKFAKHCVLLLFFPQFREETQQMPGFWFWSLPGLALCNPRA